MIEAYQKLSVSDTNLQQRKKEMGAKKLQMFHVKHLQFMFLQFLLYGVYQCADEAAQDSGNNPAQAEIVQGHWLQPLAKDPQRQAVVGGQRF